MSRDTPPPSSLSPEHVAPHSYLRALDNDAVGLSKGRLEPHLPQLAGFGTALWAAAFSQLHTRAVLPTSEELRTQRSWVGRHVRACTLMYLPMTDPDDEVDHFHTTPDRLVAYRDRLLQRHPDLPKAISDGEQLRGELTTFLG